MTIQLTNAAMEAFCAKLNEAIEGYKALADNKMMELEDAIIKACLEELWVKLSKQKVEWQKQYSFHVKPSWAFAILLQWQGHVDSTHAGITIHNICLKIDKHFA